MIADVISMEVSNDDVRVRPIQRSAQVNAKKALKKLCKDYDENDDDDNASLDHDGDFNEKGNLGSDMSDVFVNVEVKVEVDEESNDAEELTNNVSTSCFSNANESDPSPSEGPLQAKTIVAKLAHKLNSKLNAVLTPNPSDSLLEYLEPEVSMATEDSITSGGVHMCPWCPMTSTSLQSLEEHKKLYHQVSNNKSVEFSKAPEQVHICDQCGKTFGQSWRLKRHYFIHTGLRPFICVDCGEAFATGSELSCHQIRHAAPKRFECNECDDTFLSSNDLRRHMILHAPYICFICGDRFFEEQMLLTHRESHIVESCWMCLHCDRGFSSQDILVAHQKSHFTEKTEQLGFACDRCGKSFRKEENLEAHLRLHLESRLCELCHMLLPNHHHMRLHMRKKHKIELPKVPKIGLTNYPKPFRMGRYRCLRCNSRHFQFVNSLKHHLRATHSVAKTYKCGECGECFHDIYVLKGHIQVHRSVRPSFCSKCGENFKQNDWSIHHCVDQTLFECPGMQCGATFSEESSWQEHIQMHEDDIAQRDPLYIPVNQEHATVTDQFPHKSVSVMPKDTNAFKASIADKLKGTGFFTQKRNEADHFKDKIAGRLMGTGFVAEKKNEVNNFRETIAERVKEVGTLSFGNGNVSLSLLKVRREED